MRVSRPCRGTERIGESSVVYGFRVIAVDDANIHAEGNRVHIRFDAVTAGQLSRRNPCRVRELLKQS